MSDHFAFRCKNCRTLETSGQAGEREVPAACPICGHGVAFDPTTGIKSYDPDNWIVLADLPAEELEAVLTFHGLKKSQIEKHTPLPSTADREPQSITRDVADVVGAEDVV